MSLESLIERFSGQPDDVLDELVYDTMLNASLGELNNTENEDEQEDVIESAEHNASNVNNEGIEGQLAFLLEEGISEGEILEALEHDEAA
jgi:hypothetical protein